MNSIAQPVLNEKPAANPEIVARKYSALGDFSELFKIRVTSLVVMTAWTGYFMGAAKSGVSSLSIAMFHALLGIGLSSAGAAALNESLEREIDSCMARTKNRPLPARRMRLSTGFAAGTL